VGAAVTARITVRAVRATPPPASGEAAARPSNPAKRRPTRGDFVDCDTAVVFADGPSAGAVAVDGAARLWLPAATR